MRKEYKTGRIFVRRREWIDGGRREGRLFDLILFSVVHDDDAMIFVRNDEMIFVRNDAMIFVRNDADVCIPR